MTTPKQTTPQPEVLTIGRRRRSPADVLASSIAPERLLLKLDIYRRRQAEDEADAERLHKALQTVGVQIAQRAGRIAELEELLSPPAEGFAEEPPTAEEPTIQEGDADGQPVDNPT